MESTVAKTVKTIGRVLDALRRSPLVGADLALRRESSNGRLFKVKTNELDARLRGSAGDFVAEDHLSLPESIGLTAVSPEKD